MCGSLAARLLEVLLSLRGSTEAAEADGIVKKGGAQ
jgi:hypothetical protein